MHTIDETNLLIPRGADAMAETPALPRHLGIVLYGFRRWSQDHARPGPSGLARCTAGWVKIVRRCLTLPVHRLTLYVFADDLSGQVASNSTGAALFQQHLRRSLLTLFDEGVRLRIQGDIGRLDEALQRLCLAAQDQSAAHRGLTLTLAFDGCQTPPGPGGSRSAQPELVIRTGGPLPANQSMFWDTAETALYVDDTPWPDFSPQAFSAALDWFARPDRLPAVRARHKALAVSGPSKRSEATRSHPATASSIAKAVPCTTP
jgi:undecaprenyl diphosphate synthase